MSRDITVMEFQHQYPYFSGGYDGLLAYPEFINYDFDLDNSHPATGVNHVGLALDEPHPATGINHAGIASDDSLQLPNNGPLHGQVAFQQDASNLAESKCTCGKTYPPDKATSLKRHQRRCKRLKQHHCDFVKGCPAVFMDRKDLLRHKAVHKAQLQLNPTYLCPHAMCSKQYEGFFRKDNFRRHLVKVHKEQRGVEDIIQQCKQTAA